MNKTEYSKSYWNPSNWLCIAERNKFSSSILYNELEIMICRFDLLNPNEEENFISICYSYFLLVGISLENLTKGLIISKCVDYDEQQKLVNEKKYNWNKSHHIFKMIESNFRKLNEGEENFILKAEKYLRWLGKYHLPMNPNEEIINNLLNSKDKYNFETIYDEMRIMLLDNWNKNEIHYEKWFERFNNQ